MFDGCELHSTDEYFGSRIALVGFPHKRVKAMAPGTQKILEAWGFERLYEAFKLEQTDAQWQKEDDGDDVWG